jgi:hypothetical protein
VLVLGLCERPSGFQRPFPRLCLWPQNSVSWETETCSQRLGSNTELLRREAEDAVLPRPFGRQVGEAGYPHAMRQPRKAALAVLRLITSSNLVGCSIGMSAGLTPRKSLTTWHSWQRNHCFAYWSGGWFWLSSWNVGCQRSGVSTDPCRRCDWAGCRRRR